MTTDRIEKSIRIWDLDTERLHEARHCLDRISERWDAALGRLKRLVEE